MGSIAPKLSPHGRNQNFRENVENHNSVKIAHFHSVFVVFGFQFFSYNADIYILSVPTRWMHPIMTQKIIWSQKKLYLYTFSYKIVFVPIWNVLFPNVLWCSCTNLENLKSINQIEPVQIFLLLDKTPLSTFKVPTSL